MDLQTVEDIRALKYRYLRTLDLKLWDEFADTLCEDVVGDYGSPSGGQPLHFEGRTSLVDHMRTALSGPIATLHVASHPEILIDGDKASGSWAMQDTVIASELGVLIRGGAYYTDTYRREGGSWRIATTGYRRIFETMETYAGNERFALTASMWG